MTTQPDMPYSNIACWFGSDATLAPLIARQLDGCDWVGIPCVGGASIVPHLTARSILAGDAHRHLVNLANVIRDPALGPKLYRAVRRLPLHPDVLAAAQGRCVEREGATAPADTGGLFAAPATAAAPSGPDLAWAVDYFTCCWMGRGGRAGTAGEFDGGQSFRWNAGGGSSVVRWANAARGLVAWRRALARSEFIVCDLFDFVRTVAAKEKADAGKPLAKRTRRGMYLDPPWPGPGDGYRHTFGEDRQRELARALTGLTDTRVVVRYGDCPLIRELYPAGRWTYVEQVSRTQSNGALSEVLILNGPAVAATEAA